MEKIAIVYTSMGGLINTMKKEFSEMMPDYQVCHIADDSLIQEVIEAGRVTECVRRRMMCYFQAAAELKPCVIVSACSSVGEVAEEADKMLKVPVIRIDHAMIQKALQEGKRIGVIASLETTIVPTISSIQHLAAENNRKVEIVGKVAEGAYAANCQGNTELHDSLVTEAARSIKNDVDVLILAQGSMARMEMPLRNITGLSVYSSPGLCVKEVRDLIKKEEA